jgi:hypothetical protein
MTGAWQKFTKRVSTQRSSRALSDLLDGQQCVRRKAVRRKGANLLPATSVPYTFRRSNAGVFPTIRLSLHEARRYVGMALLLGADLSQYTSIDAVGRAASYKLLQRPTISASDC